MASALFGLILGICVMLIGFGISGPRSPLGGWVALLGGAMVVGAIIDMLQWWLA